MNEELRRKAEAKLKTDAPDKLVDAFVEKDTLIHDLKVHQVELEIQNEELRNTQDVLERTKEEYVRLYNDAPVGYLTLDRSGTIKKGNLTFLEMISSSTATGKALIDFILEEDRSVFLGRYKAFFNEPSGKNIDVRLGTAEKNRYYRLTGRAENLRVSGTELPEEEKQILLVVSDINEQKLAEQQVHGLLVEKDLLLREVHHRVKNNMNTIIGLLSLHSIKMEGTVAGEALEDALHRVETMLLIYETLYHSGSYRKIDLLDYFNDLLTQLESSFSGICGIEIKRDIVSIEVKADTAFHIGIICNELVTNAFKYAFTGRPTGTISVSVSRDNEDNIRFSVSDNGSGVPENFDFADTDGFGIFLVRGMLEQLGGSMEILNLEPGTAFRITIPT